MDDNKIFHTMVLLQHSNNTQHHNKETRSVCKIEREREQEEGREEMMSLCVKKQLCS